MTEQTPVPPPAPQYREARSTDEKDNPHAVKHLRAAFAVFGRLVGLGVLHVDFDDDWWGGTLEVTIYEIASALNDCDFG